MSISTTNLQWTDFWICAFHFKYRIRINNEQIGCVYVSIADWNSLSSIIFFFCVLNGWEGLHHHHQLPEGFFFGRNEIFLDAVNSLRKASCGLQCEMGKNSLLWQNVNDDVWKMYSMKFHWEGFQRAVYVFFITTHKCELISISHIFIVKKARKNWNKKCLSITYDEQKNEINSNSFVIYIY